MFISCLRLFAQRAPLPDLPLRPQEHRAGPVTHSREHREGLPARAGTAQRIALTLTAFVLLLLSFDVPATGGSGARSGAVLRRTTITCTSCSIAAVHVAAFPASSSSSCAPPRLFFFPFSCSHRSHASLISRASRDHPHLLPATLFAASFSD